MNGAEAAGAAAVAVIGMSGRFPGAGSVGAFWGLLRNGTESIKVFSDAELLAAGESPERLSDPSYIRANGRLDDIDRFDARFFGMSPQDAAVFDPQHRIFLECAWEAFEDAGHVGDRFDGPVAVFAACGAPEYLMYNVARNRHVMNTVGAWLVRHNGNDANFLATRVSYELDLHGPSMNVQSACSSSLLAVHLACQSLLGGECDMALAGGATVYVEQTRGYVHKEGEILSPDGHCRAFDARAAGTVMSSAVGCVLLRRLEDAVRDGDRILAVVRGSAVNNDGSDKVGYLAPSVSGQASVIREALALSGVDAEDVSYVEAHGTGTLIGDPIEVTALTEAFRSTTDKRQFCAIGSLKTNIGHAGEAAGVCGMIKTVLALTHREIPPSLHFEAPNPQIDFATSPFFVNTRLRSWTTAEDKPRIAGVTALGAGGTNVHVLLQEAPTPAPPAVARDHQLIVLSAKTPTALDLATKNLSAHLRSRPDESLADVAHTLLVGRKGFAHRRAVAARSSAEAADALDGMDPKRVLSFHQKGGAPSLAFMFPGGGAQYARMGAELYERESAYRTAFDEALGCLEQRAGAELRRICFAPEPEAQEANARLESPSVGLPALFATEYALAKLLMSWGLTPSAMIGHSAGEYAAACLAGVLSVKDAVTLVTTRGRLFETLPEGGMLSVELPESEARKLLGPDLSFAAINAPSMCVVSGPAAAIAQLQATLEEREIEGSRVHIRVAAHSRMLDPILDEFAALCRGIHFGKPRIPFVSNLSGTWITESEAVDPKYWVRHLRQPVHFSAGMETLLSSGPRALVEIGPGRTLSSLARQQKTKAVAVTSTLRHPLEVDSDVNVLLSALGRLWVAGVPLDAKRFCGAGLKRVALPTYPFERQRYWIDPDESAEVQPQRSEATFDKRPDVSDWFSTPSWVPSAARAVDSPQSSVSQGQSSPRRTVAGTSLVFSDESAVASGLVEELRRRGQRVVTVVPGKGFSRRDSGDYVLAPAQRSDYAALASDLGDRDLAPDRILHLWGLSRRGRKHGLGIQSADPLRSYSRDAARYHYSLIFIAQAFAADADGLELAVVSSRMQAVAGDMEVHPEKAMLLGALKVIPREYPGIACKSIDIGVVDGRSLLELVPRLADEACCREVEAGEIALRGPTRWLRRFVNVKLPPHRGGSRWLRPGGVCLITGGLGGIGLTIADHLAATVKARLILVSRTPLPSEESHDAWIAARGPDDEMSQRISRVRALRSRGTDVMIVAADVTDLAAMRAAVRSARERFGAIHAVVHTAGVLADELIALRPGVAESAVLDSKAKGALVLDAVLQHEELDAFILFSSVSSILGLPGQADYTAANAFLDAFAHARSLARPGQRTLSIDWNAWQEVGMLARRLRPDENVATRSERPSRTRPLSVGHPLLDSIVSEADGTTIFSTAIRKADCWVVSEHVVRRGEAVMPGTGFLEIARAAVEHAGESRAVEIRDVLFMAPFVVGRELRTLHVRLERAGAGAFAIYGETDRDVFVSGKGAYVDVPPVPPAHLGAIRARCASCVEVNGFLDQEFMDFGPRWANVCRIRRGDQEALVELELPRQFAADLDVYKLHPALLDMATGGAQILIPGFDGHSDFYVPFSYGRILLRGPLTPKLFSHVQLKPGASRDSAVFDISLYDERGMEIATIEGFVMRRIKGAPFAVASSTSGASEGRSVRLETAEEAALRRGMTPAEGLDALDRILANPIGAQVVASSVDLSVWLERLALESRPADLETPASEGSQTSEAGFDRPALSATYIAPRNDTERELAAMWRDLLGAREVGIHDDFFELGGQSLVAVRLFHRISKKYGIELPMATLFQAPTIAQCAEILRSRVGLAGPLAATPEGPSSRPASRPPPSVPKFRALVTMQSGSSHLLPFYCVHGAGGNVLKFRDLLRAMSRAQPFYGLQALGVDGLTPPHESIEEMASAYLEEIRQVQPHGPYLLGGYSGGGLVAFEMAQRLTAAAESVRLLAMIDTPNPKMSIRRVTRLSVFLGDGFQTRARRLWAGGIPYVVQGYRDQRERARALARRTRDQQTIAELRKRGELIPVSLRELHLVSNFERAAAGYDPKPWSGQAVLFRAAEIDYLFAEGGPCYGWDKIIAGLEIEQVPGGHHTLVTGVNAHVLARSLGQAIARSQLEAPTRMIS